MISLFKRKEEENDFSIKGEKISVNQLYKDFQVGPQTINVLKGLDLQINLGEFVIIFGPSGCGKSTLLHIMLGLEPPTSGDVDFLGYKLSNSGEADTNITFRKLNTGTVYQQSIWIKSLSVRENVALPLMLQGENKNSAINKSMQLLRKVEMLDWADYLPTELSSGQQQRVALARALINEPHVLFADEPTGNLDFETGQSIMKLLYALNKESKKTVILVTHDLEYLSYADIGYEMFDGKIINKYDRSSLAERMSTLHSKKIGDISSEVSYGKTD